MYRNATDFCISILYPATLLNSFINSNRFLVESLVFYMYVSCHLQRWSFFLVSNLEGFCFFSCLIALARASTTLLNRCGKSGHPHLIPDLRQKAFSFSLLSMMLSAVGSSYMSFIMLSSIPSLPKLLRIFIMKKCWILSNSLSTYIEMII